MTHTATNTTTASQWTRVCALDDIPDGAGAAALINDKQIALFRIKGEVYALDNHDPIGKANVLSRGILGSIGDAPCVASPLYKQHFDLTNGQCLEQPDVRISIWPVKIEDGAVLVAA